MTVRLSISVPDDVAAYLESRGNASAAVTDAVRRVLPDARRLRQLEAARKCADYLDQRNPEQLQNDEMLIESSNDIALRNSQW